MKTSILVNAIMVRTEGNKIIVEVETEADNQWHKVIEENAGDVIQSSISHIIEANGIRTAILRGFPFP